MNGGAGARVPEVGGDEKASGLAADGSWSAALCFPAEQPPATATHGADMTADITATPAPRRSNVCGGGKQFDKSF